MSKLKSIKEFTALQDKKKTDKKNKMLTVILSSGTCGQAGGSLKVEET